MDKRKEKTLNAIFDAFENLIQEKNYDDITIQDILDISKIGRSTFYSYFKEKDDLLDAIGSNIFEHVFSHSLEEEGSHDFSKSNFYDYRSLITHIFYHIQDKKVLMKGILRSNGINIFLNEFKSHLYKLADSYYANYPSLAEEMPLSLKKAFLVEDFITIIRYWIEDDFKETPERLTTYFVSRL